VKNKLKSLAGGRICGDCSPHFDVGQDPAQGNLREPGKKA